MEIEETQQTESDVNFRKLKLDPEAITVGENRFISTLWSVTQQKHEEQLQTESQKSNYTIGDDCTLASIVVPNDSLRKLIVEDNLSIEKRRRNTFRF